MAILAGKKDMIIHLSVDKYGDWPHQKESKDHDFFNQNPHDQNYKNMIFKNQESAFTFELVEEKVKFTNDGIIYMVQ